jgi:transcriptional regulator with XRE-family HTH domain
VDNNFWGNLIKTLREEQRITQRTLASKAQVNRSTLRRIETGETSGDLACMERLFYYLGYELEALERTSIKERLKQQMAIETNPTKLAALSIRKVMAAFTH